jgi:formylglycine-generating enzyme required for sulfatase activity
MNKMERHNITNDSLDQLLRTYLMEDTDIYLTEKEMDMNAAMVFSQSGIALPEEKENVLIADLEALLKKGSRKGGWWIFGLVLLLTGGTLFYLHEQSAVEPALAVQHSDSSTATSDPVASDAENNGEGPTESTFAPASDDSANTEIEIVIDTANDEPVANNNAGPFNHTRMHIPEPIPYDEYPVLAPDPVFTAKPSPENFKVKRKNMLIDTLHTGRTMFSYNTSSVTMSYYDGEPFKTGMNDFVYVNYGSYSAKSEKPMQLPWPVLMHSAPDDISIRERNWNGNTYGSLKLNGISDKAIRLATEPYYFSKYEVTNAQYKEFLQWVRTSNGYGNKPVVKTTIDTIPMSDSLKGSSGELITIKGKLFKLRYHTQIIEDYSKVYRYIFFNASDELLSGLNGQSLNVFPDTLCWMTDFTFSYNEPMTNMYRWHPAYDDYPVVGVSWFQAMAFLDWKTYMHQKQFDVQNVPYMIEYSLPSEIEWEMATLLRKQDGQTEYDFRLTCSEGWMCNLGVQYSNDDAYDRPDYLKNLFTKDQYFRGDFIADGFFHTGPSRLPKNAESHVGPLDLCWMDGNVSEWMMENYSENWKPFFDKHLAAMEVDKRESNQLAKQIELFYDKGNDVNGKLIRGSNWYDERFGSRPSSGVNEAGLSPRRYIDPKEQHSTVGFRYVIRVKYKDELQRLQ